MNRKKKSSTKKTVAGVILFHNISENINKKKLAFVSHSPAVIISIAITCSWHISQGHIPHPASIMTLAGHT